MRKKFIWQGPRGVLDGFKISKTARYDKPMDLSNYMLLRTKEKMVLEAKLKDLDLVARSTGSKPSSSAAAVPETNSEDTDVAVASDAANNSGAPATADLNVLKQVDEIRKDIDEAFVKLDRMLSIAREREETSDFPVAFVTNILYVCEKNGVSDLINHDVYLKLLKQKQDYLHLEGIGHAAYALDSLGIYDKELWAALGTQIAKKDTFQLEYVKPENYDPTKFDYVGKKGGLANRTSNEHWSQNSYNQQVQDLFFEDQYALFELKKSFESASGKIKGLDKSPAAKMINEQMSLIDED